MAKHYKVKNLLNIPLKLVDGAGDEVQIPGGATFPVDARFIEFQMPSMQHALVIGFDYNTLLAPAVTQTETDNA